MKNLLLLILFIHLQSTGVLSKKGGGGGGGSGGSGGASGGAAGGVGGINSGNGNGGTSGKAEINSVIKNIVVYGLAGCVAICCGLQLYNYCKKQFREKKDMESHLGVALAKINNVDAEKGDIVGMGVGTDKENIEDWVDDIWNSYDRDNNGSIDKTEIRRFLDQTFQTAGVVVEYTDDDFDELYEKIDITEDGLVSKAEMRNFLKKLGSKKMPTIADVTQTDITDKSDSKKTKGLVQAKTK